MANLAIHWMRDRDTFATHQQVKAAYLAVTDHDVWHLALVDDGTLPPGWRLWREGQRHSRPVAAERRELDAVFLIANQLISFT